VLLRWLRPRDDGRRHHARPGALAAVDAVSPRSARSRDLNLSPDDAAVVAERAANGCEVLGLRYAGDGLVGDRFASLRELLGDAFIAIELPSRSKRDHSVLTEQRDDASVERVLDFFVEKLQS
jgi:hypothetical protein